LALAVLLPGAQSLSAQNQPWFNESYSIEQRVDMLIGAMTLEEKVSQMIDEAAPVERLGIPQYNWWNEALHGVARAGLATVYPQAIGLAATFDQEAMLHSATIISDEARAKYHDYIRRGERGKYQGLTFWSPNINIFRDPRWGRGQETYGEDPYLTGRMGVAFVNGLQGDNPNYYKLVATAKHYAVHSGPEYQRHVFDAWPSDYDLWDTYLPAFRTLVKEAGVLSVMCAYNRFEGYPCCGSDMLQHQILRGLWDFNGYIVSDCGAITDFYRTHLNNRDAASASAAGVRAGTDLECGPSYMALIEAVKTGQITEDELDVSLRRLFYARFKLGMFSPDDKNPYAQIPYSVVDSDPHREDALAMARKSIVLLKNEANTLPLAKNIRKIAVVGPAAADSVALLGNYNGTPSHRTTILEGIQRKVGKKTKVVYKQGTGYLSSDVFEPVELTAVMSSDGKPGLTANYFAGIGFEGEPLLTRLENEVNFDGYESDDIASGLKAKEISVRWTGDFLPTETKEYTFTLSGDDGFRLFIDDEPVIDQWYSRGEHSAEGTFKATAGRKYSIRLEYYQQIQGAVIRFACGETVKADYAKLASEVADADVIIFAGGISPQLEGEEMPVDVEGFYRGDRTSIALPAVQTEMMKALHATGKPVVFVMQTGSALGVTWEDENLPAILNVWYGGQDIGVALADVLFGDYNPAGRLPVTFYRSDDDLPGYFDYTMRGRTYRYFDGTPLYPFGHGLSYSEFAYSELKAPRRSATGREVEVSVKVTNTSQRDGDEVVQLYITHPFNDGEANPICALKGFRRIHLRAGETREVTLTLTPEDMSLVDARGDLVQKAAPVTLWVGGGQPGFSANGIMTQMTLTGEPFNSGK
jgi:beta-glucosidase